jgi:cation:H+ antiporter
MSAGWPLPWAVAALAVSGLVLVTAGVRFTRVVDRLADRTHLGEALAGAVLLGATTSLPGLITTVTGAAEGEAGFAVSNAVGGIAAQTTFLALADLTYRRANLEHAAASLPNLLQTMVLVGLIGIVLLGAGSPDDTVLGVHPASGLLVAVYVYGMVLTRRTGADPAWEPEDTADTVLDEPDARPPGETLTRLWTEFAGLAVVVAVVGWVVGRSGLSIAAETGLSGTVVGALFTSVVTSLPELVTVLSAVRLGALTLAVGDIIGGNTFDVLFVAVGDVAYREGSIYHAIDQGTVFLLALTILLTAVLAAGLISRERKGIGFEGVSILVLYAAGMVTLATMG